MIFENKHSVVKLEPNCVATLTICHAGSMNILGTPVIEALLESLQWVAETPSVRVLIVRGQGEKAFIGGADINEMVNLNEQTAMIFIDKLRLLCESVRQLPIPVIARIPGWTLGGGLEFALCCDIKIASRAARLGMPEVLVGIPSVIHASLMPRLIGKSRTAWLLLTGEVIDAEQSLAWGMLDKVVDATELDLEVTRVADGLVGLGAQVLAQQKRLLREWEDEPLETSILNSITEFGHAFNTGEPQHYMGKFLEHKMKRRESSSD